MENPMTNEYMTESVGLKAILAGFVGNVLATVAEINWMTILTLMLMIGGAVIQVLAYFRGRRAEQRDREAERRDKEKHGLEIALLKKQLAEENIDKM